jgi:hypothetical protein
MSGMMARAVSPAAQAPSLRDRPQPPSTLRAVSAVALAPAAMSALIEAQERLADDAPASVRQDTVQKIDQLIYRLVGGAGPAVVSGDAPAAVRRLQAAREALSRSLIDLLA